MPHPVRKPKQQLGPVAQHTKEQFSVSEFKLVTRARKVLQRVLAPADLKKVDKAIEHIRWVARRDHTPASIKELIGYTSARRQLAPEVARTRKCVTYQNDDPFFESTRDLEEE